MTGFALLCIFVLLIWATYQLLRARAAARRLDAHLRRLEELYGPRREFVSPPTCEHGYPMDSSCPYCFPNLHATQEGR